MVVSLFHLHVFFHCVWATLLWLNCPFASFTKWLWWVLHKCAHVNEQSEDKAGSVREKAIQTGDALNWDFDTGFFSCIISQGPPSHCVDQVATATALELNKETSPDIPLLDNISTVKCRQRVRQQVQTLGCITPIHNWRASFFFTMQPITDPDFLIGWFSLVGSPALTVVSHQITAKENFVIHLIFGSFVCSSSWNDYIIISIIITNILLLCQLYCSIEVVMW